MSFEVIDGSYTYPGASTPILTKVSFCVEPGELLAILGPNGAGKTTLLRTMLGLQHWDSGRSLIDGEDMSSLSSREIGRCISYVPQARNAGGLPLTGVDMVMIGRAPHLHVFAQPGAREREQALHTLEGIGALDLAHMPCASMSGGQFQMILIARALVADPKVLVLDEPETGLDFRNQLIVLDLLESLVHDRGLSVIMNTHYPAHAMRVADRVLMLGRDHVARSGSMEDMMTPEVLAEVFGVDVCIGNLPHRGEQVRAVVPVRPLSR